jgi:hypothetical protein
MVGKIKRRSLKITYLLAAFLGWTASAAIANAAPIFTFASFAMSGIDVTVMNVTVSGAFINGNGGANPNPCGTGVTNCAFMVSGNPYGAAAATNMTINSAASWNTVSNRVGLGPDKQYGTADDFIWPSTALLGMNRLK